jgi:ABC-type glycerol-3-phosphate transport system permease component
MKLQVSLFKKNISRSVGGNLMVFLLLLIVGAFLILPLVYVTITAFKPINEIYIFPPQLLTVKRPTIDNFIELSQVTNNFWVPLTRYLFNSVFVSVVATIGHLILSSMAAYPLSKHIFYGRKTLSRLVVLALLFTGAVTYIPQYIIIAKLGMIDTYWALISPAWQATLGLYLMQNFMCQIPNSILEAARIDGASEFRIYLRIVMPNVKPAWLTVIIFAFQGIWNNTGGSMIYTENMKMMPAIISQVMSGGIARAGVSAAASLIIMIPPIILFILSQNMIIETMSTSGMK